MTDDLEMGGKDGNTSCLAVRKKFVCPGIFKDMSPFFEDAVDPTV